MARLPNQCMHIMVSGAHCALNAGRARNSRTLPLTLPFLEDADSINVSLTETMRLLAAGQIDRKTASLMLYSLQIATSNLQHITLDKLP
jgi:hypothetical protein